jgi:hypothetical protein
MISSGKRLVTFIDFGADKEGDKVPFLLPEFQHVSIRFLTLVVILSPPFSLLLPIVTLLSSRLSPLGYSDSRALGLPTNACILPLFTKTLLHLPSLRLFHHAPAPSTSTNHPPQIWETPYDSTDPIFPCSIDRTAGPLPNSKHMYIINHFLDFDLRFPFFDDDGILIPDEIAAGTTNSLES